LYEITCKHVYEIGKNTKIPKDIEKICFFFDILGS